MEVLQHQAHLAEVQREREMAAQAHLAELERQRELEVRQQEEQRQIDQDQEVLQHQAHLDALQHQREHELQMDHDREDLQHQDDIAQQLQMDQQDHLEHIQQVMNNNQVLRIILKGCRPYREPSHRHFLGPMDVQCPSCHAVTSP